MTEPPRAARPLPKVGARGTARGAERYFRGHITPGFIAHLFKAVCKQHHRELVPLLRPYIPEDAIVFDVGAHAGQFAKLFAVLAPRGFIYAFEPGTYARTILRLAIRLNRFSHIAILPLGLGERSGVARLTLPVKRSGSYGFGLAHLGTDPSARPAEIEIVALATVDAVVAALGLERLDFIKADIEGYEAKLVAGAQETLARLKPVLFLEMNEAHLARAGDSLTDAWQQLTALGYRPHTATADATRTPLASPVEGDILWLPPA